MQTTMSSLLNDAFGWWKWLPPWTLVPLSKHCGMHLLPVSLSLGHLNKGYLPWGTGMMEAMPCTWGCPTGLRSGFLGQRGSPLVGLNFPGSWPTTVIHQWWLASHLPEPVLSMPALGHDLMHVNTWRSESKDLSGILQSGCITGSAIRMRDVGCDSSSA